MHKSLTTILFFLTFLSLNAQNTIIGIVKNAENNSPLEFSQIALMEKQDSTLVTGTTTDLDGRFRIETRRGGDFLLRVSFIGFEELWMPVTVESGRNNLSEIYLAPGAQQLSEVQVTAAAALFRSEADRRVFNVENMTVAEGGTAIQLLETLPSVQVDEEGRISLRGSGNVLIYINGRPTNLASDDTESILEQYPSNAIKEVELITNPSARYEAEGVGGIINIILKEQRLQGFNGQVNVSSGTGNKYTAGVNLNMRQGDWNFFTNYSYQYREMWEITNSFRENFIPGLSPVLDQDYYTENWRRGHLLRFGTEYHFNPNSSLRAYSNINARSRDRERIYNIRSMTSTMDLDSMYVRLLEEDQSQVNYEVGADYGWQNDNGRRFRASASYAWNSQDRIEYFDQSFLNSNMQEIADRHVDQFYERPLSGNLLLLQADFQENLGEDIRIETGLRSEMRFDDRAQNFGQLNRETGSYNDIVLNGIPVSNAFTYERNIHAAYVSFTDNRRALSYQLGLRGEYTNTEAWQDYGLRSGFLDDENFSPVRDTLTTDNYFRLFPSAFLNYRIGDNQDIQASYSRRIRRPWTGSMMPFLNAQDFFNLRLGNPYLQPASTNNFEINYIRAWENYMVTGGVFHRYTTDAHSRLFVLFNQGSLVTWNNANTTNATGVELINYFTWNDNFDATLTANYYYSQVSSEVEGRSFSNESYSWTLSLLGNMNFPGLFSTQLSANYWGPRVIPQGFIRPVFSMNIGMRRNVFNNQGTISLNISDVFNTRKFSLETNGDSFFQEREFYRESRVLTLSFTWRFRDYRDRNGSRNGGNGYEGDMDSLF
ncbi:MAG: TonB-dependent receptor [Bacteroidetes bacterium]|nr:MAG: TonB-dependent receptor [Bacteroidota bacterium]